MSRLPTPDVLGDVLGAAPSIAAVDVDRVRIDGGTQMRASLDDDTVQRYVTVLQDAGDAWPFPVITVFYDGQAHWMADGFHRHAAARRVGRVAIPADIRAGTQRDAVLFAAGANASHGLPRSQADKRRSVRCLLTDPEWCGWADREIARRCNVSADLVGQLRRELYPPAPPVTVDSDSEPAVAPPQHRTYTTKAGTVAVMDTSRIGQRPEPSYIAVWAIEQYVSIAYADLFPQEDANAAIAAAAEMRRQARAGVGNVITYVANLMDADGKEFRKGDLIRAINKQCELLEQVNGVPSPAPAAVDETPAAKLLVDWTPDDWAQYEEQQQQLAPVLVSQRDDYDSDEWYTPEEITRTAAHVMGSIDLDPASCELAQTVVQAAAYYTKIEDGLHQTWQGNVWLNPPYSQPQAWVDKLFKEMQAGRVTQAIVLVNNATETAWFQRLLGEAKFACFPSRRLAFWRHDHSNVGARQGQCLFYFGNRPEAFYSAFGATGVVLRRLK